MYPLYNLREWLCDCERFLFLAEVHCHNEAVIPSKHQFCYDLSGQELEELIQKTKELCKSGPYCISFDCCLSADEFTLLRETLDHIRSDDWDGLCLGNILRSQEILQKLENTLDEDIMKAYKAKGFSSL